jgi:hypothetical protein
MKMWIPYTRVPYIDNLTYTSIYNNSNTISNDLWSPNKPSPGNKCVNCFFSLCRDAPCTSKVSAHICSFTAGAPIAQLKGFCPTTGFGKKNLNNHRKVSLRSDDKTQECWRLYFTYSLMFLAAINRLGTMTICPRQSVPEQSFRDLGSLVW